ncbi:MAG: Peptide/nickel transport system ATP-binding protein [Ilumatobacteraceae bacterium]|nr:Peptide/nickel transport system ATP-binding protein [Ilumatobacteraceae bacterium]
MSVDLSRFASTDLLRVEDLVVSYRSAAPRRPAVNGVSFGVAAGETLGLVGESGCGKTSVALALARSLPLGTAVTGAIHLGATDVNTLSGGALRAWWRSDFAMVYQEPQAALNPTMRVGHQIAEVLESQGTGRADAAAQALELLDRVAMPDPRAIARRYPHQLSGGQQQRVVIAMALAIRPRLLVLDEPTTGLDATVEREILELIAGLRDELSAAVVFITHDLGLVARMCDRVAVLSAGEIVETGPVADVLDAPTHEYTRELLAAAVTPGRTKRNDPGLETADGAGHADRSGRPERTAGASRLVDVRGVTRRFGEGVAVDGVDLHIDVGEVVGLVGESGSGKTTLGRIIAGLTVADAGTVELRGEAIAPDLRHRRTDVRRSIQMVFQSPDSTLNPRHRVREVLGRALKKLGGKRSVEELAASCRLDPAQLGQLTTTLSGGQKQRVAIARAIAGDAALVVCDEPVSALDVSVQATILRLLVELQEERDVSLLFVSHDLAVVRYLSDRIAVMYAGRILEHGPTEFVLSAPFHPYTAELFAASERRPLDGATRTAGATTLQRTASSTGCPFANRCAHRIDGVCERAEPPLRTFGAGHVIACHLSESELLAVAPSGSIEV